MISIVIPVYNAAAYLPDMLDSIISQSYTEIEIILVNDGSVDNSSIICHKYEEQYKFITVYDRQNYGASASRNFGVEKASGEFIWFMDSDDIVIGGMNFCFVKENKVVPKKIQKDIILSEREFKCRYNELFSINYISSLCNKLIRRSIIVENGIKMNESLHMYEDYAFCMDVLLKCKTVVCLSRIFYNYKLRNTKSLSHRYKDNAVGMFSTLEEKISEYRQAFGDEFISADTSLNNLLVYFAYECVKNEARHKNPYTRVKKILCDETFCCAMSKYNAAGRKYRIIQIMMKKKMVFPLLMYFVISKKI